MRSTKPGLHVVALVLVCVVNWASPTSAQTASSPVNQPKAWDVSVVAGAFAGHPDLEDTNRYRDSWYDTGHIGLVVGRYVSTNLKVELELSTSGEGRQYVERYVMIPSAPSPVPSGSERFTTLRQVSGSLIWQLFENEWVHPFLQAGVATDIERVRFYTPAQSFYVGDPRVPGSRVVLAEERREGPDTTTTAAFVLGGGAKVYAAPHVFIRADGRVTGSGKGHHVTFRLGVGIDF